MITGITLLGLGIVLLVSRYYLDTLAQKSARLWYDVNCHPSCPVAPLPDYWYLLQPLIYLGVTIFCTGIILLLGMTLSKRMKSLQK